jgi:hypothetical protein
VMTSHWGVGYATREYFYSVAPGPVLGRIPEKRHLASEEEGVWSRCVATSNPYGAHMVSN